MGNVNSNGEIPMGVVVTEVNNLMHGITNTYDLSRYCSTKNKAAKRERKNIQRYVLHTLQLGSAVEKEKILLLIIQYKFEFDETCQREAFKSIIQILTGGALRAKINAASCLLHFCEDPETAYIVHEEIVTTHAILHFVPFLYTTTSTLSQQQILELFQGVMEIDPISSEILAEGGLIDPLCYISVLGSSMAQDKAAELLLFLIDQYELARKAAVKPLLHCIAVEADPVPVHPLLRCLTVDEETQQRQQLLATKFLYILSMRGEKNEIIREKGIEVLVQALKFIHNHGERGDSRLIAELETLLFELGNGHENRIYTAIKNSGIFATKLPDYMQDIFVKFETSFFVQ
eukprot:Phypoly_transcript_11176.p1 GENE.Phypoly_transcript_11176~~Phypoly_transcript_11176.p1  ORF type:complete len:346 (+),score=49.68 Phypoly_transcript_11176:187-1224(+)